MDTSYFLIIFCLLFALRAHAQYIFCTRLIKIYPINSQSEPVDYIVIPLLEDSVKDSTESLSCKWIFAFNFSINRIIMLNGLDTTELKLIQLRVRRSAELSTRTDSRIWYRIIESPHSSWKKVESKMLFVQQLQKRTTLSIEFDQNPKELAQSTPGLRIRLMQPGFCSKEVVNCENNCYTTSLDRKSAKEQLTSVCHYGQTVELASFRSATAMQNFVNQSLSTRVACGLHVCIKTALNLTQPVRIGMFYDRSENSVYYLANNNGELQISLLSDSHHLYYEYSSIQKVSCGAFRINLTFPDPFGIIDFRDCDEPLPVLLRFPDSGRNCCFNCRSARAALDFIENKKSLPTAESTYISTPRAITQRMSIAPESSVKPDFTAVGTNVTNQNNCNQIELQRWIFMAGFIICLTIISIILVRFVCVKIKSYRSTTSRSRAYELTAVNE